MDEVESDVPDDLDVNDTLDAGPPGDDKIVSEAKKRFNRCADAEGDWRKKYIDDLKFAEGDADNQWQWPSQMLTSRGDERPCLTINRIRQHNLQIINDAKQNKPSIKIKGTGNGATYEAAQILEGVIRHIEYISNAQSAYDVATSFQVKGGLGYWRVVTDYAGDDTFDQEIFIRPFKDPLTVYLDPDIKQADGSDARFAIVFDDMPKDEAKRAFPQYADILSRHPLSVDYADDWTKEDTVRIAEYYRCVPKKDRLLHMTDPNTGEENFVRASKLPPAVLKGIMDDPATKERELVENEVQWFLIIGNEIADRSIWPGKYIPIVRVIGEETNIEGILDRKGHTRAMKDPQRMANYWFSAAVEHVALQSKTPYIGPMGAFSNLETYWDTANVVNHSWLPYNAYDDQGRQIPPPQRQQPPVMSAAYIQGMQVAQEELDAVSGQYRSEMGDQGDERSGIAIQQRQRQGDNATYHFIDNQALAIRFTGKIVIDLIPKIYDTPRIIRIMAEDGVEKEVQLDPKAQQAYFEKVSETKDEAAQIIFNPNIGRYDVEADVGPGYATRRQEAFNALSQIMGQDKELMKVAGDLLFKAADFPMSEELAQRIKRMIPPNILGEGPDPQVQQLTQHLQQVTTLLTNTMGELGELKKDRSVEGIQKNIDAYKAENERLKLLAPVTDPRAVAEIAAKMVLDILQTNPLTPNPAATPSQAPAAPDMQMLGGGAPQQPQPVPQGPMQ